MDVSVQGAFSSETDHGEYQHKYARLGTTDPDFEEALQSEQELDICVQYSAADDSIEYEITPEVNPLLDVIETDREVNLTKKKWPPQYGWIDIVIMVFTLILITTDVVSDMALMVRYNATGRGDLFCWTLGFMLVPSIVSGMLSIVWTIRDIKQPYLRYPIAILAMRIIFAFVRFGRALRYFEFLFYVIKCQRMKSGMAKEDFLRKTNDLSIDTAILGLIEGFLGSALQLLLQLSLAMIFSLEMDYIRVLSMMTSWLTTSVSFTIFYCTSRQEDQETKSVARKAVPIYFLLKMAELGPRFIILASGISFLPAWIYICVGGHLGVVFTLHIVINRQQNDVCLSWKNILFVCLISFISIFCFSNPKKGQSRKFFIIYYFLFYAENIVIMAFILSLFFKDGCSNWWHCAVVSLFPGWQIHVVLLVLYYCFCHPDIESSTYSLRAVM